MEESQKSPKRANISPTPQESPLASALERLGFRAPGAVPTADSPIQDVLLYALVPHGGLRPDLAMVLAVACELEALMAFAEGPIQVAFEMLSRRLRTAVDLSERMAKAAS